jgi:lysophospholipase L1-like esterase
MNFFKICILLIFFSSTASAQWTLKDTTELVSRDGLPNFMHKIRSGQPVSVGFFGGSITQAEGWRPKITEWMRSHYRPKEVRAWNAAIGGTNSTFGVFRLQRHLLEKDDLDLIFVEFAVNDSPGNSPDIVKSMEGIVRKIWTQNPKTDIFFVYTLKKDFLQDIEQAKMSLSMSKHDSIASHYGIPSLYWGVEVDKKLRSGEMIFQDQISDVSTSKNAAGKYVFAEDGVHPSDYGHQIYADVLARSLIRMESPSDPEPHSLKPALFSPYEAAAMLPAEASQGQQLEVADSPEKYPFLENFLEDGDTYLLSEHPEASYRFQFEGSKVGMKIIMGPGCGPFTVTIDGKPYEKSGFDGYCSYYRINNFFVDCEPGLHEVVIRPAAPLSLQEKEDMLNKPERQEDIRNKPAKYDHNYLIFSDVLILGEMK